MKISKGTIIRTIMLIIVVVNMILKYLGYDALNVNESEIEELIEMLISIATIIVCYWKNNSVSKNAIKADSYLKYLKGSEKK